MNHPPHKRGVALAAASWRMGSFLFALRGNMKTHSAATALPLRTGPGAVRLGFALLCLVATAAGFAAAAAEKTFDLAIARGSLPAEHRVLRVNKGDALRLRLTSDAPGEIHLHGYRLEAKLTPGTPSEIAFKAYATGRYRLEWHPAGQAKSGSHHGPPLATLEVRPQ